MAANAATVLDQKAAKSGNEEFERDREKLPYVHSYLRYYIK